MFSNRVGSSMEIAGKLFLLAGLFPHVCSTPMLPRYSAPSSSCSGCVAWVCMRIRVRVREPIEMNEN